MAEIRLRPFISRCPPDAQQRALRRGTTRLVGRARTNTGEKFFVSGMNDHYEINIETTPSCSCPDWAHPCKHLCFVYLDILGVPASSPIWWQTALLQSEVDKILPHRRSKRPSDTHLHESSSKKQRVSGSQHTEEEGVEGGEGENKDQYQDGDDDDDKAEDDVEGDDDDESNGMKGPLTTEGLELTTVRSLILRGTKAHPSCIKYIEALRPTILDGLSDANLRLVLLQIAGEHADVAVEMDRRRKKETNEASRSACVL